MTYTPGSPNYISVSKERSGFNQQFIQAALQNLNYGASKLPLGKLGKATILKAFEKLKKLAVLLDDPTLAASRWNESVPIVTEHLSNGYYSLIPHDFGRRRPPIIGDKLTLRKKLKLLESLVDIRIAIGRIKVNENIIIQYIFIMYADLLFTMIIICDDYYLQ